jgi:hypothetical protein
MTDIELYLYFNWMQVKEVQNIFYFPLHRYYQNTTIVIETCLNIEEVGEVIFELLVFNL